MKGVLFGLAGAALVAAIALACSSSSSPPSGPSCQTTTSTAMCTSCESSKCGSQVSMVESACSSFESCYCACAAGNTSCQLGCTTNNVTPACTSASEAVVMCSQANCQTECQVMAVTDSGGGGMPTGSCATVQTCCGTMTGMAQSECNSVVATDNQFACSGYLEAGLCH
jgi:hypothetical protein